MRKLSGETKENFEISISDIPEDNITIITTQDKYKHIIEKVVADYDPRNSAYSTYLNEISGNPPQITPKLLDSLALNAQSTLNNIMQINSIVRKQVNKNDIIGKVEEIISANTNTDYRISYKECIEENDVDKLKESKQIINDFNDEINLKSLIRNATSTAHMEGNYICYCRKVNGRYIVNWYPLGLVEVSDYDVNGEPVILINMKILLDKIKKTIKRKKNKKALFYEKLEKEIKDNYPPEVLQAYQAKDDYAKLDYRWTGIVRINNQNRKYGLTPIFRALYPALMIEQFDDTNMVNAKVKAKKFIVQLMRSQLISGDNAKTNYFEEQAYNHNNLLEAFSQKTVLVTCNPTVEDIKYVSCSDTGTIDINTVNNYRERILSSLGVGFLMSSNSTGASTASISLSELLKTINSITSQIEVFVEKWYKNIIWEHNLETKFAPKINILDSELLSPEERRELATVLLSSFGASRETCFGMVGLNLEDETNKRSSENDRNLDKIFTPYQTSFTYTNEDESGRPESDNVDTKAKRDYDKEYNNNART